MTQPSHLVQLAHDKYDGTIGSCGVYVEQKHHGVRASWIKGQFVASREGTPIGGSQHIAQACREMERIAGCKLLIDGEFMVMHDYQATLAHVTKGDRALMQGQFHCFDVLPLSAWEANNSAAPLWERKAALRDLISAWQRIEADEWEWAEASRGKPLAEPAVSFVEHEFCISDAEVQLVVQPIWLRGGEGVVIKDPDSPYRRLKSPSWRKLKQPGWATRKVTA
jgi:ATP-dependent DNA ligase